MKRLLILTAALIATPLAAQSTDGWVMNVGWTTTNTSDMQPKFVTDRRHPGKRLVWTRIRHFAGPKKGEMDMLRSAFDCAAETEATTYITAYRADGSVMTSGAPRRIKHEPIIPGSVGERMLRFACNL